MFSGSADRFQVSLLLYWSDINVLPSRTNIFRENRWRRANSRRRNSRLLQVVYTRRDNNQSNQHQDTRQLTRYCNTVTNIYIIFVLLSPNNFIVRNFVKHLIILLQNEKKEKKKKVKLGEKKYFRKNLVFFVNIFYSIRNFPSYLEFIRFYTWKK